MSELNYVVKELSIPLLEEHFSSLAETYENIKSIGSLSLINAKGVFNAMRAQDAHVFVAVDPSNGVIGCLTVLIEQKFIRSGAIAGHIEDMVVRKGFEKKGVASALIKEGVAYAQKRHCYKIILDCDEDLVPFYEKFGFEKSGAFMRMYD